MARRPQSGPPRRRRGPRPKPRRSRWPLKLSDKRDDEEDPRRGEGRGAKAAAAPVHPAKAAAKGAAKDPEDPKVDLQVVETEDAVEDLEVEPDLEVAEDLEIDAADSFSTTWRKSRPSGPRPSDGDDSHTRSDRRQGSRR